MQRVLFAGGVAALAWCGFILAEGYIAQQNAREQLALPHDMGNGPRVPQSEVAPRVQPPSVAAGTPLAELAIPRLGLSAIVLHGSDEHTLRLGLGHIENTPFPGESGNVAIAGHRDSFFRPLRNIRIGDDIMLNTPEERIHYRVSSYRVVDSHEVSVIGPTKDAVLTLVTCYPFWFIGQAPDRFIVRATEVDDSPTAPASAVPSSTQAETPPVVAGAAQVDSARSDDEVVREAIERFRVAYNSRLARRGAAGGETPLALRECEVSVTDGTAAASCAATASSADSPGPTWTFRLAKFGGDWAVTSVGTN